MATQRRSAAPALLIPMLLVSLLSCGGDDGPSRPDPLPPLEYGALVTPRASLESDPLLVDGYQNFGADGFTVAHLAISWAQVEKGPVVRDWRVLDLHVHHARQRGLKLSVVLEFIHGGRVEIPAWMGSEFPGWESQDLGWALARFLREMGVRSQGTIGYLWLGEGADRYAAADLDDDRAMVAFISMIGDSARAVFPTARIGTLVDPVTVVETGKETLVRALRDSLDLLGLCLDSVVDPGEDVDPATALARIGEGVAPWSDGPLAIIEIGYPSTAPFGSSEGEQAAFASLVAQWLTARPRELELFCWSPLHDAGPPLADSLALRRHPSDAQARTVFAAMLSCSALRRFDGSPKPGRQRFFEERP